MNSLSKDLLDWFQQAARDMPWRENKDPYKIWVSEIMLQQTQVNTVRPYFERFIRSFPTLTALAEAELKQVLKHWEGLGYYSRARNLHKGAHYVLSEYGARMPQSLSEILKIPGIGPYTAGAILSIAFDLAIPAVDGNVVRVMSRLHTQPYAIDSTIKRREIEAQVQKHIPEAAGDFNQALMELGALICTPKSPQCATCPVQRHCQAYQQDQTTLFPVKKKKTRVKAISLWVALLENEQGEFLFCQQDSGIFKAMWCLPGIENTEKTKLEDLYKHLPLETELGEHVADISHTLTHRQLTLQVYRFHLKVTPGKLPANYLWIQPDTNQEHAIPVAYQKVFRFLAEHPLLALL